MENKHLVHTEIVKGSKRVFFLDLKKSENGKHYLVITQSQKKEDGTNERKNLIVFENEIGNFMSAISRSILHFEPGESKRTPLVKKEKNKEFPNAYKKWSQAEEKLLTQFFEKGATIDELSVTLQRNPGGIQERLKKLGLISEEAVAA